MPRIMIIAGEASGDLHAAKVVKSVAEKRPDIEFYGIGGPDMKAAGVNVLVDSSELAVVGIVEIWTHRKVIFSALHQMEDELKNNPPDMLLLVDYPEFNLRLARTAKECGIKVLYYISPQVWAWRQYRVKKIRERVDMMAVVFPFEEAFYLKHHVPVKFVGHPLVEEVKASADKPTLLNEFGLNPSHPVIGLFPGSRRSEIKRLFPIILQTARKLKKEQPDIQFLLPLAPTLNTDDLKERLADYGELDINIISNRAYDVMKACDVVVTVSGTVTLEIALIGTPMVIINKVAFLTYAIVHRMLKIEHIGLCNIVADRRITPELIQYDATPEKILDAINRLLSDKNYYQQVRNNLLEIENMLGVRGGIENIANLTIDMLDNS